MVILAASVVEISCGKQTTNQQTHIRQWTRYPCE